MAAVNYEIRNDELSAVIRQHGAELASLKDLKSGREYIWQADPAVWAGSAPVLFPIVGRLLNDHYEVHGKRFKMGGHGFARRMDFNRISSQANAITLELTADNITRTQWPFEFVLSINFCLSGSRLIVDHTVQNAGEIPMPFTIGAHPAFSLTGGHGAFDPSQIADFQIGFDRPETLDRYQLDGPVIGEKVTERFVDQGRLIDLTPNAFEHDAYIFKNIHSQSVSLIHRDNGPLLSVETGGAPHLGIWAKPQAPFVCIEPWHGYSDSVHSTGRLEDKPSMKRLDPGYGFDWRYAINIH